MLSSAVVGINIPYANASNRDVVLPGGPYQSPESARQQTGGLENALEDFEIYAAYIPEFRWVDVQAAQAVQNIPGLNFGLWDECVAAAGLDEYSTSYDLKQAGIRCVDSRIPAYYTFAVPDTNGSGAGKGVIQFTRQDCSWLAGAPRGKCQFIIDGKAYPGKKAPPKKYDCKTHLGVSGDNNTYPPTSDPDYRWCVPVPKKSGPFDIHVVVFQKGRGNYVACNWSFSTLTCGSYFEANYQATAKIRANVSKNKVTLSCYMVDGDEPNKPAKKRSCRESYDW